jgi:hypothetical protein
MTDTIQQSMNFFNALWDPREGHGLRESRHHRTRLVEEIVWMQKHVRGVDWSDERDDHGKK